MTAIPYDQARRILLSRFADCSDEEISEWIQRKELPAYIDSELTRQYIPGSPHHKKISHTALHFDAEGIGSFSPSNRSGIRGELIRLREETAEKVRKLDNWIKYPETTQEQDHVFRKQSNTWEIVFNGEPCDPVPHTKGMTCIRALLENPGKKIKISELEGISAEGISDIVAEEHGLSGTNTVSGNDPGPDNEAVKQYKAEVKRIEEQILSLKQEDSPDTNKIETLKNNQTEILSELTESRQKRIVDMITQGNSTGTTPVTDRKRIDKNISKAIAIIGRNHKEFAEHLAEHLTVGSECDYTPPEPTTWQVR